jgi:thiol-disulfide isomerase/thioredoxin
MEEDSNFSLRDPSNITTAELKLKNMSLPNLDGNLEKIYEEGKGSIIQIFGSWCPNCIDETKFILEWRKEHKLNLNIKMVSFERSPNKEHALKMLKKTKALYGIDYPILIGGYNKEDKVSSIFPNLNNFTAFPTTLFVDKSGTILRIHVGFSGPATGKYYEKFKRDFNELAEYLAKE